MSEKTIEKHLADILETKLFDFFAKSIKENLQEAASHFGKIEIGKRVNGQFYPDDEIEFPALSVAAEKVSDLIENGFHPEAKPDYKNFILKQHERGLIHYFDHKWQETFFLLMPLFITTYYLFDEQGSKLLDKELRDEMLIQCGLDTAKKRKRACLDYLATLLLEEKVTRGGSKGFWCKTKRLQFLGHYNRFFLVIKHALEDYKILNKQKLKQDQIWEQIQQKYEIPSSYMEDFLKLQSPSDRALEWAKLELKTNDSNEHLRNRVLTLARKEAKAATTRKNPGGAVGVILDENNEVKVTFYIDTKDKNQTQKLRFTAPTHETINW